MILLYEGNKVFCLFFVLGLLFRLPFHTFKAFFGKELQNLTNPISIKIGLLVEASMKKIVDFLGIFILLFLSLFSTESISTSNINFILFQNNQFRFDFHDICFRVQCKLLTITDNLPVVYYVSVQLHFNNRIIIIKYNQNFLLVNKQITQTEQFFFSLFFFKFKKLIYQQIQNHIFLDQYKSFLAVKSSTLEDQTWKIYFFPIRCKQNKLGNNIGKKILLSTSNHIIFFNIVQCYMTNLQQSEITLNQLKVERILVSFENYSQFKQLSSIINRIFKIYIDYLYIKSDLYAKIIQQNKGMIQHRSQPNQPQQNQSQILIASNPVSPDLFLFQQIVVDILNYCKRNLKVQPFDDMQVDSKYRIILEIVQSNKTHSIDIYQQYFIIGLGSPKTRDFVCSKYQQLVRDNLINKDNLPPQMITGIINARSIGPGGGGSTASSGSNSIVGSSTNINVQKSINVGKLVSTIICNTIQPSSQISAGLFYLLQGSRSKTNGNLFTQLIEDTYSNLIKFRKKPIDRFLNCFLNRIISQVEFHEAPFVQYQRKYLNQKPRNKSRQIPVQGNYLKTPSIMIEQNVSKSKIPDPPPLHQYIPKQISQNPKDRLCVHLSSDQDSKFGKCFICDRGAKNYDKILFLPLCSMQCKNKLKRINQQCIMNDHFNIFQWILDLLKTSAGNSDQILYSLLLRQICESQKLSQDQIGVIMEIIISNFSLQAIGITSIQSQQNNIGLSSNKIIENSALIMSHLTRRYTTLMLSKDRSLNQRQNIMSEPLVQEQQAIKSKILPGFHNTKIIISQMLRLLQILPILSNSIQITLLKSLMQILSSKQYKSNSKNNKNILIKQLYLNCDCKILESNLVERIFNVVTQYALHTVLSPSASASNSAMSSQNLGTNSSLSFQNSNNANLGMINNLSLIGANCPETAIIGLQDLLSSLVQVMESFNTIQDQQILEIVLEKKVKRYMQTKFVEQFNKKPVKAVDKLRKLFNNQISGRQIAIFLRQNMDYDTKVKKIRQHINKQEVGTYFGTTKKDKKNNTDNDFSQEVYWQFLKLQQHEYEGKEIDDCLRITFNSFMMPKQGQQVQVVLGPLSLMLQPYLGLKQGKQATCTYQLIMVALMVQTSNNPNVKENQKLKFQGFKNFCSQIDKDLSQSRMTQIYNRIKKRPLQIFMQYKGSQVFVKKYLKPSLLKTQFWKNLQDFSIIQEKKQGISQKQDLNISKNMSSMISLNDSKILRNQKQKNKQKQQQKSNRQQVSTILNDSILNQGISNQTTNTIDQQKNLEQKSSLQQSKIFENVEQSKKQSNFLSYTLLNLWQYIYMSLVNKNNLRGLQQACILYGYCQLYTQYQAFFKNIYKIHQELGEKSSNTLQNISNQAKLIILKLAIDYSNYVICPQSWFIIIKMIYKLDNEQKQSSRVQNLRKPQNSYAYYEYQTSDKLFTRTNTFKSQRLKQFLQAMCLFSSSEVKTDKKYTRQMYILHHITEIIEYNLERFENKNIKEGQQPLWYTLWPIIRSYFRSICIHPIKQIGMSAIDSYKQLTMKMLKLNTQNETIINHTQLMKVYLYVFQRSSPYIKDLIINILLNVVCKQMNSGWNQLYTILQISDSEDKTVVMKVVNRLIKDVGLIHIGNLLRFHQIIIKQLRIAKQDAYNDIIQRLWQVCQHFNRLDIWLQTLSKIKDIYKSSTHIIILSLFYRICNKCIKWNYSQVHPQNQIQNLRIKSQENKKVQQNQEQKQTLQAQKQEQMLRKMQNQIQQKYIQQSQQQKYQIIQQKTQKKVLKLTQQKAKQRELEQKKQNNDLKANKVDRLVYFQVFSVQMHILEIRQNKLFIESLSVFKQLNLDVFFRNLGRNRKTSCSTDNRKNSNDSENFQISQQSRTGFLTLWQMFLSSSFSISFCYFLHDYFSFVFKQLSRVEKVLLKDNPYYFYSSIKSYKKLQQIKIQILLWLVRIFMQTTKDQVLQLSEQDSDLNKSFSQILQKEVITVGRTELIQFYLSSKDYQAKSIQHLVFLKIIKLVYQNQIIKNNCHSNNLDDIMSNINHKILQNVVQSFDIASKLNNKPLLRNFLWNNDFFKAQDYLPGLMKQQIRSLQLLIRYFNMSEMNGKIYHIIFDFILTFIEKSKLVLSKYGGTKKYLKQPSKKQQQIKMISPEEAQSESSTKIVKILYQDLGLWITNCEQVMTLALKKLTKQVIQLEKKKAENRITNEDRKYIDNVNNKDLFSLAMQLSKVVVSKQILKQCGKLMEQLVINIY